MGKANLKILAEAWLQIIENYCADFQEPYPPTEVLKDILDWMPTAEGDSLIECEWFDKNFPPVATSSSPRLLAVAPLRVLTWRARCRRGC